MSITPKDRALVSLPFLLLACAGSSDVIDLGGGSPTQSGTGSGRCAESTIFSGNVFATQQSDLEELAGCEEITGDLIVAMFPGASLLPLSSLRQVGGVFALGTGGLVVEGLDRAAAEREQARLDALREQGWLESLEGLEALHSVGEFTLAYLLTPDLHALGQLEKVGGLGVLHAKNLRDLSGLENAEIGSIGLIDNQLESLHGLQLGATLESVNIDEHPQLHDIDALAPVSSISHTLSLSATGLENLEGLAGLVNVYGGVSLRHNPKLVNVSRLAQLEQTSSMTIVDNDALSSLPSFEKIRTLQFLYLIENAVLEELYLHSGHRWVGVSYDRTHGERGAGHLIPGVRVDIQRNQSLRRITSAGGFREVTYVTIEDNPALTDLDLPSIERVDYLSLNRNATLTNLNVPALRSVDSLEVMDNPALSLSALANVKTFERVVSGNAEEP